MLLYGPPGTGKTLLVRTLAAEAGLNLIAVAIPQLVKPEVAVTLPLHYCYIPQLVKPEVAVLTMAILTMATYTYHGYTCYRHTYHGHSYHGYTNHGHTYHGRAYHGHTYHGHTYQVGASERALASLFERARAHAPCLLFLDELQAIFGKRGAMGRVGRQLLSQLLLELDATQAGYAP